MWLNDLPITGTKSDIALSATLNAPPSGRAVWLCCQEATPLSASPSFTRQIQTRGEGVRRGGYKQASHKRCCSNIPVQGTDFHTVVQPNIGIVGVYRVHRCWEALSSSRGSRSEPQPPSMPWQDEWGKKGFWWDQDTSTHYGALSNSNNSIIRANRFILFFAIILTWVCILHLNTMQSAQQVWQLGAHRAAGSLSGSCWNCVFATSQDNELKLETN